MIIDNPYIPSKATASLHSGHLRLGATGFFFSKNFMKCMKGCACEGTKGEKSRRRSDSRTNIYTPLIKAKKEKRTNENDQVEAKRGQHKKRQACGEEVADEDFLIVDSEVERRDALSRRVAGQSSEERHNHVIGQTLDNVLYSCIMH